MVRFNFIISFALAAQGLQAAPSQPSHQLKPLSRDVSQPAQDAVYGYPVQIDKRAKVADKSDDACESEGVKNTTKVDATTTKRPTPTGFPDQNKEEKFQKDRQEDSQEDRQEKDSLRGGTKHKDAEKQRKEEKDDADDAREANKQAAIDRDTEEKKEQRKKDFEKQVKDNGKKKEEGHQNAHNEAQNIVNNGEDLKNGKKGVGNKPLPTKSQGAAPTQ